MNQYVLVAGLMIGAGFLGGITNFYRIDEEEKNWFSFRKHILLGVSASFLIPLFLNMISSNLLAEAASDVSKYFIFFGFCLIASLSSKSFIQTLSDRLLNEVRETKEGLETVRKEVEPIVSKETERQEGEATQFLEDSDAFNYDEDTNKVLDSLDSGRYAWRSVTGIMQETSLTKESVLNALNRLSTDGMVLRTSKKGRWGLTSKGRDFFFNSSSLRHSK